jgi:hypothetical protein
MDEFALNGQRGDDEVTTPYFIMATRELKPGEEKQQAVTNLAELLSRGLPNRRQRSVTTVTVNGLEGFELLYDAEDSVSRTPMFLYYVGLFQGNTFYFMHGSAEKSREAEWLPEYRAMVQGWQPPQ